MSLTKEQIEQIAATLAALAASFSPKNAQAVAQLIGIATQLNSMIHAISNQTEEDTAEVWEQVRTNYADAVAAFNASAPATAPLPVDPQN